jgi:hypothetical protein
MGCWNNDLTPLKHGSLVHFLLTISSGTFKDVSYPYHIR